MCWVILSVSLIHLPLTWATGYVTHVCDLPQVSAHRGPLCCFLHSHPKCLHTGDLFAVFYTSLLSSQVSAHRGPLCCFLHSHPKCLHTGDLFAVFYTLIPSVCTQGTSLLFFTLSSQVSAHRGPLCCFLHSHPKCLHTGDLFAVFYTLIPRTFVEAAQNLTQEKYQGGRKA